jgi:hypothetical protein
MRFSKSRIIKIAVMLVFLSCMLFANFIAVRMMLHYGAEAYFYDKLLVAYTVGGQKGLKMELEMIPLSDKSPAESMLARDFTAKLAALTDPEAFLKDKVKQAKKTLNFIRNLRSAAIVLMLIIFGWQVLKKYLNICK